MYLDISRLAKIADSVDAMNLDIYGSNPENVASVDRPYISLKYWWGIKFGVLAVCKQTAKLKSVNFFFSRNSVTYRNAKTAKLKSTYLDFRRFSRNPPNIIPANISGYTVVITT